MWAAAYGALEVRSHEQRPFAPGAVRFFGALRGTAAMAATVTVAP